MNRDFLKNNQGVIAFVLLALIPAVHLYLQYFGNLSQAALERLPLYSWIIASGLVTLRSLLAAARAQSRTIRVAWVCLALATGLWMSGIVFEMAAFAWIEGFTYGGTSARLFYLGYPTFLVAGLFALTLGWQRSLAKLHLANLGMVACAMLIYSFMILLEPVIQTSEPSRYIGFTIADLTLMLTAIIMAMTYLWSADNTNLRRVVLILGLSACLHAAINIIFYYRVFKTGHSGNSLDVFWVFALLMHFWAAHEQDRVSSGESVESPNPGFLTHTREAAQIVLPSVLILGMLVLMLIFSNHLTRAFAAWGTVPAILFSVFLGVRELEISRHRKQLMRDLHEIHSLNAHVLRTSPGVIFVCEARPGYRVLYFSENSHNFFGVDSSNFEFSKHLHPDDRTIQLDALKETMEHGESSAEFRVLKDDKIWRWVNQRLVLKHDANGNPVEIVGTLMDVTERRLMHSSLEQTQRLESLGRLSGSIAHDFNNLLTSIMGFAGLLLDGNKLGAQEREQVSEIQTAGERGAGLTRQLLSFSRRHAFTQEVVELNGLIKGMRGMLERLLSDTIELKFHLSPLPVHIEANKSQLEQVVLNLVINGRDAMPNGGQLSIVINEVVSTRLDDTSAIDTTGRMALLTVCDQGIGMNDQIQQQIFDPFFTTKVDGTGLGLATVHGVVRQHGGYIEVKSSQGSGTTFDIYLPTTLRDIDSNESDEPTLKPLGGTERILVVDDEVAITRVIASTLKPLGYTIMTANNADEALSLASKESFDLLLTDIVMPGCNGQELNRKLRKFCSDFAVVYMSGYTDDALARSELDSHNLPLLQKPLIISQLAVVLRRQLDGRPVDIAKLN